MVTGGRWNVLLPDDGARVARTRHRWSVVQEGMRRALRRGLRSSPGCTRGGWCGAGVRSELTAHSTGATQDGATRHSAAGGCAVRRELGARGAGHGSMMRTLGVPKPLHRSIFQMLDGFSSASWSVDGRLYCSAAFPPMGCGTGHTWPSGASADVGHGSMPSSGTGRGSVRTCKDPPCTHQSPPALAAFRPWGSSVR